MHKHLVVVVAGCLSVGGASCGLDGVAVDGTVVTASNRIVGGAGFDGLPAVGAITYYGDEYCTGTLIGPRTVVTAAHCVDGVSPSQLEFVIGSNIAAPEAVLTVKSAQTHPSWSSSALRNDIGLITLAADAPVAPLPVLTHMDASWIGTQLFFVGYGVTNGQTQAGAGVKRAVWMGISEVDGTTFRYDDPGKNTCSGDSGGPAFYRDPSGAYYVAGITSYGDWYCTEYGVDTRVDAFLDFLGQTSTPPATDPCAGETFVGRCDGTTVVWCENDTVQRQECAASGKICTFDSSHQYYACGAAPAPAPTDPCNGETYEGRCEEGTVIWCEDEQVKSIDCDKSGKRCGFDAGPGYFNCLS
jgi:hypothetical protein